MASGSGKSIEEVLKAAKASDEILDRVELAVQKDGNTPLVYLSELGDDEAAARDLLKKQIVPDDKDKAILDAVIQAWREERAGKGGPAPVAGQATISAVIDGTSCSDADKTKAKDAFAKATPPLTNVSQLGGDPTSVSNKATTTLNNAGLASATVNTIVTALVAASTGAAGAPVQKTGTDSPPTGPVSLSGGLQNIVLNPDKYDSTRFTFELPVALPATPPQAIPSLATLSWADWLRVAINCNLTKAIRIAPHGLGYPDKHAFYWLNPTLPPDPITGGGVGGGRGGEHAEVKFTYEQHAAHAEGFADAALSAGYFGISANADANWKAKSASASASKTIYMSYKITQPIALIHLKTSLQLSKDFIDLMTEISQMTDDVRAFIAIEDALNEYGHIVPSQVEIGGNYVYENVRTVQMFSQTDETDIKVNFEVAANSSAAEPQKQSTDPPITKDVAANSSAAVPPNQSPSLKVTGTFDSANASWKAADSLKQDIRFYSIGGNTLDTNPTTWKGSLPNFDLWRPIYFMTGTGKGKNWNGVEVSTYDSLLDWLPGGPLDPSYDPTKTTDPASLYGKIIAKWQNGRQKAWAASAIDGVATSIPDVISLYAVPAFWSNGVISPVTIKNASIQAEQYLKAAREPLPSGGDSSDKPEPYTAWTPKQTDPAGTGLPDIPPQPIPMTPAEIPGANRITGSYWQHFDPAPIRAPLADGTNPVQNNLVWKFQYTGALSGDDGAPLYWIVSKDDQWLLSAFEDKGYYDTDPFRYRTVYWASLLTAESRTGANPSKSPAAWAIYPADPSGVYGQDYADCFLLYNNLYRLPLGPEATVWGRKGWYAEAHDENTFDQYGGLYPSAVEVTKHFDRSLQCDRAKDVRLQRSQMWILDLSGDYFVKDVLSKIYSSALSDQIKSFLWHIAPPPGT